MKKIGSIFLIISIIVLLLVLSIPKQTQAIFISTPSPEVWDSGTEVNLDLTANPPPDIWTQALSNGDVTTGAGTICHPFRKAQFGWVGAIYELMDGKWVKLDTTVAWIPDTEGTYTACAYAPAAGTYAIFGYFDPALAPEKHVEPPK
jgi:hypothetical protein